MKPRSRKTKHATIQATNIMKTPDEMQAEWDKEIELAGVQTEQQLRDSKSPHPKSIEELVETIKVLVERPHSYGTCVYAMSLSAVAAFNYVASKLGVSGFQASCADLDILRRTRHWEWGTILNYDNLLYPQYCNAEKFPSVNDLLSNDEIRERLKTKAKELLLKSPDAHPTVLEHWRKLAA